MTEQNWEWPVISQRTNGDQLIGIAGELAQDLYEAGTPPMHGLAARYPRSPRLTNVSIGDRLRVKRTDDHWTVSDGHGQLGVLRWGPKDDGRRHAVTGKAIRLPRSGTLHVQRLLIDSRGTVKDIGGYVEPD